MTMFGWSLLGLNFLALAINWMAAFEDGEALVALPWAILISMLLWGFMALGRAIFTFNVA